jgi:hypothetical protein
MPAHLDRIAHATHEPDRPLSLAAGAGGRVEEHGQVAGAETNERVEGAQVRHHDFARFAGANLLPGVAVDDLDDRVVGQPHGGRAVEIIGEHAQLRGGVGVDHGQPVVVDQPRAVVGKERLAGEEGAAQLDRFRGTPSSCAFWKRVSSQLGRPA